MGISVPRGEQAIIIMENVGPAHKIKKKIDMVFVVTDIMNVAYVGVLMEHIVMELVQMLRVNAWNALTMMIVKKRARSGVIKKGMYVSHVPKKVVVKTIQMVALHTVI